MKTARWECRPLSRCVRFLSGGTPSKARDDFWNGDIPWVSSGEMTQRHIHDTALRITEEAADEGSRLVPAGTVLIVVRGMSLAKEFRVAITKREVAFNQDLKALACEPDVDSEFLFYSLLSHREHIRDLATEASHGTKKLDTDVLTAFEIAIPKLEVQRRVVGLISAYDDLIENNRRRMALLEEAARQLYQEWFVRLRFPGHEHIRITDGVPEGWTKTDLQSACISDIGIQTGPFGSQLHQSDYSEEGIPVVMPKDIIGSQITTDTIARVPDEIRQRLSRHVLQTGDIVLARRGDIGRKAFVTEREAGWMCGTGCMRLRPNSGIAAPRLLYDTIGRGDVMGIIVGRAQGAIMPNLNMSILADIPLVLPTLSLQREYVEFNTPVHRQIQVLAEQNEKLRAARDLLLPRLMSGEVAV